MQWPAVSIRSGPTSEPEQNAPVRCQKRLIGAHAVVLAVGFRLELRDSLGRLDGDFVGLKQRHGRISQLQYRRVGDLIEIFAIVSRRRRLPDGKSFRVGVHVHVQQSWTSWSRLQQPMSEDGSFFPNVMIRKTRARHEPACPNRTPSVAKPLHPSDIGSLRTTRQQTSGRNSPKFGAAVR